jgi:hypothetical protein
MFVHQILKSVLKKRFRLRCSYSNLELVLLSNNAGSYDKTAKTGTAFILSYTLRYFTNWFSSLSAKRPRETYKRPFFLFEQDLSSEDNIQICTKMATTRNVLVLQQLTRRCHFTMTLVGRRKHFATKIIFEL